MAQRPSFSPYPVITNGDMSGSLTSVVTIIQKLSMISYSLSWAGTSPVGTVSVQASNDYAVYPDGTVKNAGTWSTLTLSVNGSPVSTIAISGNTGNGLIDLNSCAAYAIRLIYTRTSGSGTMQAVINAKVA